MQISSNDDATLPLVTQIVTSGVSYFYEVLLGSDRESRNTVGLFALDISDETNANGERFEPYKITCAKINKNDNLFGNVNVLVEQQGTCNVYNPLEIMVPQFIRHASVETIDTNGTGNYSLQIMYRRSDVMKSRQVIHAL